MMNTRLDSSVRIKTRIRTEVTLNRICANAYNSGNYGTRLKCSQDWFRLGFASATSRLRFGFDLLRLDYALALIFCEHCRSSRNNPHYAPRHIIYYSFLIFRLTISPQVRVWDLSNFYIIWKKLFKKIVEDIYMWNRQLLLGQPNSNLILTFN